LPLSLSLSLSLPLPFSSLIFTVTLLVSLLGFESFGNRLASSVPVPAAVGVTLNCTVPSAPGANVIICPIPVFTPFKNRLTFRVWLLLLKFFTVTFTLDVFPTSIFGELTEVIPTSPSVPIVVVVVPAVVVVVVARVVVVVVATVVVVVAAVVVVVARVV